MWIQNRAVEAKKEGEREAREAAAAEQARLNQEAEEIVRAAEAEEREAARKEEEEKNRAKFVPVKRGVELPNEIGYRRGGVAFPQGGEVASPLAVHE